MPRVNWEKIKAEYVSSDMGQQALADKHKVSRAALSNRCAKEGWVKQREESRQKVGRKLAEKIEDKQVSMYAKEINICDKILSLIEKSLEDVEKMDVSTMNPRTLKELADSLKTVGQLKRDICGDTESGEEYGVIVIPEIKEDDAEAVVEDRTYE